jgi:hypothetical protein
MSFKNIEARIKRNKFVELAGIFYRDGNSQIVKTLNDRSKKALLGIQNESGVYTIIGEKFVYYKTESGVEGEILNSTFLEILKKNAWLVGKTDKFEVLRINEKDSVWILNGALMSAMWNTVLLLSD